MDKVKVVCPACNSVNAIPKKEHYNKAHCGKCKASLLQTAPVNLTAQTFDVHVVNNEIPVIVDFWAPWCGPCKAMGPVFEEVAKAFSLKASFAKVDTEIEQSLATAYGIRSIPTLIVFKNAKEVHRIAGAMDEQNLKALVKRFI